MIESVDTEAKRLRTQAEWDLKQAQTQNSEERKREEERRRDEDDFNSKVAELKRCLLEIQKIKEDPDLATHEREALLEECFQDEQRFRSQIAFLRKKHPEFREEPAVN